MLSEPKLKIAAAERPLVTCTPQLMPFHIDYTGPAPLSTFFRVREVEESIPGSSSSTGILHSVKKRLIATFRGRTIQGLEVPVPEGYGGVILRSDGPGKAGPNSMKQNQRDEKKGNARGEGKRPLRRTRSTKALIEDEEKDPSMDFDFDQAELLAVGSAGCEEVKLLRPSHIFSSLLVWNQDIPVDDGRDEYIRAFSEWMTLAAEVHRVEDV